VSEGAIRAGRLEVEVEAVLRDFAAKLKEKVQAASGDIQAQVGVEIDGKYLRAHLQEQVDEAALGVSALIDVLVDTSTLREQLKVAVEEAAQDVKVGADTTGLVEHVVASVEEARVASGKVKVDVEAEEGTLERSTLKEWLKTKFEFMSKTITIPVKADTKSAEASAFKLRGLLGGGLIVGLISLIQPALGAISQLVSGLTAITAAALPAVDTIAGIPIVVGTMIQAMLAGKLAMQGFAPAFALMLKVQKGGTLSKSQAKQLKQEFADLAPSAQTFATRLVGLRDEWIKTRKVISEPLFKALADNIKPLAHELLPTLQTGLAGTNTKLGGFVTSFSQLLRDASHSGDLGKIFGTNNQLLGSFLDTLGNISKGMIDFEVAAAPFTARMGKVAESFGLFFRDKAAKGRQSGSTAEWLTTAGDRLNVVWNLTKNIASGFHSIFKAADVSVGKQMLTDFEGFTKRWADWTGGDGQARIQQFFKNTQPGFHEIALIIKDMSEAWLKMGESPQIVGMLNEIRTGLGPALNQFLTQLGQTSGPAVIDMLTQLLRLVASLAPVTAAMATAIGVVAQVVGGLVALVKLTGPVGSAALSIAGYVAAYMILTKVPLIGPLVSAMGQLVLKTTGLKSAGNYLTTLSNGLQLLRYAGAAAIIYTTTKLTGMIDTSTAAGKATNTFGEALGFAAAGAVAFGPVGAIVGGTLGLIKGAMDSNTSASDRAREAWSKYVQTVRDFRPNLEASEGEITAPIRKQAAEALAKTSPVTLRAASKVGLTQTDILDTMLGDGGATERVKAAIAKATKDGLKIGIQGGGSEDVASVLQQSLFGKKTSEGAGGLANSFKAQRDAAIDAANAAKTWGERISGLGPHVQTALTALRNLNVKKGTPFDATELLKIQEKFKLKPADVRKVATAFLPTTADIDKVLAKFQELKDASRGVFRATTVDKKGKIKLEVAPLPTNAARKAVSGATAAIANAVKDIPALLSLNNSPVKTATNGVVTSITGPIRAAIPNFKIYGTNMSQGLAAGMSTNLTIIQAAAQAMADAADKAVRAKAEIKSPSKVMTRLGAFIAVGFAQGILGNVGQVKAAAETLFKIVGDQFGEGREAEFRKRYAGRIAVLEEYARERVRIATNLAAAEVKLSDLQTKKAAVADGLKVAGQDYSSVSVIANANGGFAAPGFLVAELRRRLANTKAFASSLTALRKKGFGEATVREVAGEGIEGGLALAKQLLTSTAIQVGEINSLQTQITNTATNAGTTTANALYNAGIAAAQGLVNGLKSQQKQLEAVAKSLATSIVKEIKKELGIKSPSRVLMAVGAFTTQGLSSGLSAGFPTLLKQARGMSTKLAAELSPPTTPVNAQLSVESAAASAALLRKSAADSRHGGGSAPLIENLTLTAGTPADASEVLDETMHALRKIRNGGIYADRVA
jgi:hypothetical protein